MKLLVTGGAGFIGSNFIRYWLERHNDDQVMNFDVLTYAGCQESLNDVVKNFSGRYSFFKGDIRSADDLTKAIQQFEPDVIVNFAAESHNSYAIINPGVFMETNALGTQRLLEAVRKLKVPRIHHISTCEVYGDLALDSKELFTELSPYRPRTPYNASKAAADMIARVYFETFKLPVTISNCSNNYGPYQFPEKVIPHFSVQALQGEKLTLYKSSRNRREWIHVLDHCSGIEAILQHGKIGETYNIGSGEEADVEMIAGAVLEALQLDKSSISYVPDRPSHDRRYLLDSSKIRQQLGWAPEHKDLAAGLRETVLWYKEHPEWWRPLLGRAPVDEGQWK